MPYLTDGSEEQAGGSDDVEDFESDMRAEAETAWAQREWTIQHVLFPAMKLFLKPPSHMASDGTAVQVQFCLEGSLRLFARFDILCCIMLKPVHFWQGKSS